MIHSKKPFTLLETSRLVLRQWQENDLPLFAEMNSCSEVMRYFPNCLSETEINDLAKKIIKFNKNNRLRRKIAKNGREKYHKYFNSKTIAEYIINKTYSINNKKFY